MNYKIRFILFFELSFRGGDNSMDMYQNIGKIVNQPNRQKWSTFPFKTIQEMKHTDKVITFILLKIYILK